MFTPVKETDFNEYLRESFVEASSARGPKQSEKKKRGELIQEKARSFLKRKKVYNPLEAIQKARSTDHSRLNSKDRPLPIRGKSATIKESNLNHTKSSCSPPLKRTVTVGKSPLKKLENTSSTRAFLKKKVHNITSKFTFSLNKQAMLGKRCPSGRQSQELCLGTKETVKTAH